MHFIFFKKPGDFLCLSARASYPAGHLFFGVMGRSEDFVVLMVSSISFTNSSVDVYNFLLAGAVVGVSR